MLSITSPAQAPTAIGKAVTDQIGIVADLQAAGAQYVLVPNLPDLGLTPMFRERGQVAAAGGTTLAGCTTRRSRLASSKPAHSSSP